MKKQTFDALLFAVSQARQGDAFNAHEYEHTRGQIGSGPIFDRYLILKELEAELIEIKKQLRGRRKKSEVLKLMIVK